MAYLAHQQYFHRLLRRCYVPPFTIERSFFALISQPHLGFFVMLEVR